MNKDGFHYVTTENGHDVYELSVKLADDGTPDSDRYLIIQVIDDQEPGFDNVSLNIVCPKLKHIERNISGQPIGRSVGSFNIDNLDILADLLYGAATVVTVRTLKPIYKKPRPVEE